MVLSPKQESSKTPKEPAEEKLEFLKREEVRTMAKDIAKVREEEAKKEQERIASLKKEAERPKRPEVVLAQHPEAKKPAAVSPIQKEGPAQPQAGLNAPQVPEQKKAPLILKRPLKRSEKLFIRLVLGALIVFVVFNAVAFGFWYFFKREPAPEPAQTSKEVKEPPVALPEEQNLAEPAPIEPALPPAAVPVSFFQAPQHELLLGNSKELLKELQSFLAAPPALGFLNIVVKTQLGILSTEQFLEKSGITMPPTLKEKLTENTMLFSYYNDNKKRLGIIFELKDTEGVTDELRSWEPTLEQDTSAFFDIIGGKGSAYAPSFRSAAYQGVLVRFQTFSVIDFGIVYGLINNKLMLTSSFESFQGAVDQLQGI